MLGVSNKLTPYEKRRAIVFNYCNLSGFLIASIRLSYLAFFSKVDYSWFELLINSLPLLICFTMAMCMVWQHYRTAITISFVFFPPTLVAMMLVTGDKGIELYLVLFLMFVFFFLHHVRHIVIAGLWVFLGFLCVEFGMQYRWPGLETYSFKNDSILYVINCVSAVIFIVVTAYMIKFQVWHFEKTIRKKKQELDELNQVKDKVFSVISHDLSGPIASLINFVQAIEENEYTEQEFRAFLPALRGNLEQTSDLLSNLLSWSRSQMKNLEIKVEKVSLYDLASKTFRQLATQASDKNILLINEVPVTTYAFIDGKSSEIVLRNLVANAIKFTGSGGTVVVRVVEENGFIQLKVKDNGVGIHPEKQKLIFSDKYYTTPGTLKEKGSGLGLIICRDLVEKGGGQLFFESQYQKGTEFTFSIPRVKRTKV